MVEIAVAAMFALRRLASELTPDPRVFSVDDYELHDYTRSSSMENLTDLQLAVMKALWELGEGTVGEITAAMAKSGRVLAPTTVATLLHRLGKSGWVKHRRSGKVFVYKARVDKSEAANGALARLVRSFFGGRMSTLAAQLLESEQLTPEDLEAMKKLLEKRET